VNLVGAVLGDAYQLTRLVGQGGMGAVYEGTQLRLGRRVAVKVMARELAANPEALARFRREAEVTSQLGHPHIVQVFDFGTAPGGEPYLVMEFLEGEDLEKRLARVGRLGPGAASHIVKQIASALAATHAKGIVHRDLKPANVFVLAVEGETDFVKVVDFGISKVRAATTRLTAALAVMGTPNYMAPEQAAGRVDEIDHRTDQWALGCIAYELCAGRPPFIGEDVASLLYQVIHEAAAPLSQTAPGLGPELDQVLRRSLSKGQGDRFPTMTAFAQAFEEAAARSGEASGLAPPAAAAGGATTFPGSVGEAAAHAPSASRRWSCARDPARRVPSPCRLRRRRPRPRRTRGCWRRRRRRRPHLRHRPRRRLLLKATAPRPSHPRRQRGARGTARNHPPPHARWAPRPGHRRA
jgi:serine/threonine-protein kinase